MDIAKQAYYAWIGTWFILSVCQAEDIHWVDARWIPHPQCSQSEGIGTYTHEGTHWTNSIVRNRYAGTGKQNAIYLNGKASLLKEPRITLSQVARAVPGSCRGMSFNLYMIQQARDWNNEPLYVLDEWSAYLSNSYRGRPAYSDAQQSVEFMHYAWTLLAVVERTNYNDKKALRATIKRMTEMTCKFANDPRWSGRIAPVCQRILQPDCKNLRSWVRQVYGEKWASGVVGNN